MNERISIKQAVAISGLSENYIRKSIAKGEIRVTKETIGETRIEKNWIDLGEFEAWKASKTHSKREDGRNKFVLYMDESEAAQLEQLAESFPFLATLARANKKAEVTE